MRSALAVAQFHGSRSSRRWAGWSAMRASTSGSQACGSTSLILAVTIRLYISAARCPWFIPGFWGTGELDEARMNDMLEMMVRVGGKLGVPTEELGLGRLFE